jgi:hypothetical protein
MLPNVKVKQSTTLFQCSGVWRGDRTMLTVLMLAVFAELRCALAAPRGPQIRFLGSATLRFLDPETLRYDIHNARVKQKPRHTLLLRQALGPGGE